MAAVRAVNFALDLSFTSIMIEDDLEIIIKALYIEDESFSSYDHLIVETKFYLASFSSFQFSHIRRHGNNIAHKLVKHVSDFQVWMEDVSPTHQLYSPS